MPKKTTEQLAQDLHTAIKNGDVAVVSLMLSENPPDVVKDICHKEMPKIGSSLHSAGTWGDAEIAKLIVDKGHVNVNIQLSEGDLGILGKTPLHESCAYGNGAVTRFLISRKANPNVVEAGGLTPLHSACQGKNPGIVPVLLKAGADINAKDHKGETPLLASILRSPVSLTKCLIDNGCDVTIVDNEGQSALHYVTEWGNAELIDIFLTKHPALINLQDNNGLTALHIADDTDIRDLLIKHGADKDVRDKKGRPAIEGLIDMEKEQYRTLDACLQKHLLLAEKRQITCNAEVAEAAQQKYNRLAIAGDSGVKNARGNVMAELLGKGNKLE